MTTAVENKIDRLNESFRDKILRKCSESVEMKEKFFEKYADDIERLSRDMAKRFVDGKKLLTMGNGGSLCDAVHFAVEFTHPIVEKRVAFPVISLVNDTATMTAVSNDIDFSGSSSINCVCSVSRGTWRLRLVPAANRQI